MLTRLVHAVTTVLVLATLSVAPVHAIVIPFGPSSTATDGGVVSIPLAVPTSISGDATLEITVQGDLNMSDEWFETLLDSTSIGTASGGPGPFPFPGIPTTYGGFIGLNSNVFTDSTSIANAVIAPLIADGTLLLDFDTSSAVGAIFTPNAGGPFSELPDAVFYVQGTLSYDEAVPEPATLALLGLGIAGIGYQRRKRVTA